MSFWKYVPENALLIDRREELGLSQEEVAKKAGITLKQYQRYEKNGVQISSSSTRIVNAVFKALELSVDAFGNCEYAVKPIPEDDPLHSLLSKL